MQGAEIVDVVDVEAGFGRLRVLKVGEIYNVEVNGVVRHPGCAAEDAMRALGNYLHSQAFSRSKRAAADGAGS